MGVGEGRGEWGPQGRSLKTNPVLMIHISSVLFRSNTISNTVWPVVNFFDFLVITVVFGGVIVVYFY